jgi:hypothetical protein
MGLFRPETAPLTTGPLPNIVCAMRCVSVAIVVALVTIAAAQSKSSVGGSGIVRLNLDTCVLIPSDKESWLPQEWKPFQAFVKLCPVTRGRTAGLYLMSVWADDFYHNQPAATPAVKFPRPLLLRPDGTNVGELPTGFPSDPPRTLRPIFLKWSGNFPHEIRLWLRDPTVLGDRYLPPLTWDESTGRFSQKVGKGGQERATKSGP